MTGCGRWWLYRSSCVLQPHRAVLDRLPDEVPGRERPCCRFWAWSSMAGAGAMTRSNEGEVRPPGRNLVAIAP